MLLEFILNLVKFQFELFFVLLVENIFQLHIGRKLLLIQEHFRDRITVILQELFEIVDLGDRNFQNFLLGAQVVLEGGVVINESDFLIWGHEAQLFECLVIEIKARDYLAEAFNFVLGTEVVEEREAVVRREDRDFKIFSVTVYISQLKERS